MSTGRPTFLAVEYDNATVYYLENTYVLLYRCGHLCYLQAPITSDQCCRCLGLINRCKACA